MHFLRVVISKMALKVDLEMAERRISQSLNSGMLHQGFAVCVRCEEGFFLVCECVCDRASMLEILNLRL